MRLERACEGVLIHRRRAPVTHEFRYPVWMLLADVDELAALDRVSRWLSVNRPNVLSLRTDDHLEGRAGDLRARVEHVCREREAPPPGGPILLLTQPRSYGFDFNPVSFFLCMTADGSRIECVLAEVTNTPWNERHVYLLAPPRAASEFTVETPKRLHVSPFNDMEIRYRWRFRLGAEALHVAMRLAGPAGSEHFDASLALRLGVLDRAAVRRGALLFPAQSLTTLARIYRQAFALWRKGAHFYTHPARATHERSLESKRDDDGHARIAD